MGRETIYEIACEMLESTNVFNKEVSAIRYVNSLRVTISLQGLLEEETSTYSRNLRGKSARNIQYAYDSIALAMATYLEGYPAPFSFKQKTKKKFGQWLDKIGNSFAVSDTKARQGMASSKKEVHTGVAILKMLHDRKGATVKEMADELGLTPRAIQKELAEISACEEEAVEQLRLGGQPLHAKIVTRKKEGTDKEIIPKRYYTRNSVNPLVLQENIMQLGTLLRALSRRFWDAADDSARIIAIDIWSQMSQYAQEKIKTVFIYDDEDLESFVRVKQR